MENGLLPVIFDGNFRNGKMVKAMPKCCDKYCLDACKLFYEKLCDKEDGSYMCPSGFSVYKRTMSDKIVYYSGLRIKGFFNKKKKIESLLNEGYPIITTKLIEKMIEADDEFREVADELEKHKGLHKELLHDIRKLDGLIKNKTEEIINQYAEKMYNDDINDIVKRVQNIQAMEEIISCKYSVYDLVSNIDVLDMGTKNRVSVYKKFDKVRYILINYKNKGVKIDFRGETDFKYYVNPMYFEILPFLLLENAVKYSVNNQNILVEFEEVETNGLNVLIQSYGPYCTKEEVEKLFKKNYRGDNAKKYVDEGTGIGLYLVKQICDQHGIDIKIGTEYKKKANGIPMGYFNVNLSF